MKPGTTRTGEPHKTNPVKAIKQFCAECLGFRPQDIPNCTVTVCPLFAFRMGSNPYRTEMSEERREKLRERAPGLRRNPSPTKQETPK
jgi:hypothetical protein